MEACEGSSSMLISLMDASSSQITSAQSRHDRQTIKTGEAMVRDSSCYVQKGHDRCCPNAEIAFGSSLVVEILQSPRHDCMDCREMVSVSSSSISET